jgi:hypothetical protein
LGVAVGLRGYGMCQMCRAISEANLFKKFEGSAILISCRQCCPEVVHLSAWEIFIYENCRPFFFETEFLSSHIATNVCVSSVVRLRSRALSPTQNVERRYKLWATPHRTIEETFC